jgi:putative effector of murein hydrolase
MIASLSLILICQLIGEIIVRGLALPMPGPVVGLMLLLLLLLARDRFVPLARGPALVVGSITAIVSVVVLAETAGLPHGVVLALASKSVTAGVAMGISEQLRADPSLTAVAVILTGIMGAIIVTPLMNRARISDFRARGFAAGLAAHGIGTARAFQVDAVAGVFSGIAMSLNALVTSLLVPLAVTLLVR